MIHPGKTYILQGRKYKVLDIIGDMVMIGKGKSKQLLKIKEFSREAVK